MAALPVLMRWHVINELLARSDQKRFLEIGVQHGICGSRVVAREKWGVDPEYTARARPHYRHLSKQTSDAFFASLDPSIRFDVVMVDGLHHADQVLRDVDNALKHLADGGTIVMHDCNPLTELAQRVPRETGIWNGDCWKAMVALRARGDVTAFTINSDHGIGVVRKVPSKPIDVPSALTYDALERDRTRLLGLVDPAYWDRHVWPGERIAIVSAIFGGRDEPKPIDELDTSARVLFTDGDGAPGWTVERMTADADPRRTARSIKALALEMVDADVVVWIDGRIVLRGQPLRPLISRALATTDIAGFPHPWRDCAYEEARECGSLGLAPTAALDAQVSAYEADRFPRRAGLWNTMVLARRKTDEMVDLGRAWWSEMQRHTLRDQVSLPYLLWKRGIVCGQLGSDVYRPGSSRHFRRGWHAESAT
jgi:hypothetical protein